VAQAVARVRDACPRPRAAVRAWGEMVNVLWKEGDLPAAQALERHWNDAIARNDLWLLCSYHVANLDEATHRGLLHDLAAGHGQLIPAEDYDGLERAVRAALEEVFGPAEARTLWSLFEARQAGHIGMPTAEAVLVGLHDLLPAMGTRVLRRAKLHAQGGV
jgi:hypothetical protein